MATKTTLYDSVVLDSLEMAGDGDTVVVLGRRSSDKKIVGTTGGGEGSASIERYADTEEFPVTGSADVLYISEEDGFAYTWDGEDYRSTGADTLQEITDNGSTTTNELTVQAITANDFVISNDVQAIQVYATNLMGVGDTHKLIIQADNLTASSYLQAPDLQNDDVSTPVTIPARFIINGGSPVEANQQGDVELTISANQNLQQVLDNGSTATITGDYTVVANSITTYGNTGYGIGSDSNINIFQNSGAGQITITTSNGIVLDATTIGKLLLKATTGVKINTGTQNAVLDANSLTSQRTFSFPDSTGTLPISVSVNGGTPVTATSTGNIDLTVSTSGSTNLTYTASPTNGTVNSDTGSDATIPAADTTNAGLLLPAEKTAIGTISGKANLSGGNTFAGTQTFSGTTTFSGVASGARIALFDGSKNLVAASNSYPNLTELTYLKDVTSPIQTQFNNMLLLDSNLTKTADYTVISTDYGKNGMCTIYVNATSGAVTITLEAASAMAGKTVHVIKTDASANSVTVKGNGTTNINMSNTYLLGSQYERTNIKSNGTQYYIF